MNRLEQINVDENRWELKEIEGANFHSFKVIDKKEDGIYTLKEIIGLNQVTEDEFLVLERKCWTDYILSRLKFQNLKQKLLFQKKFDNAYYITDDNILFTYNDNMVEKRVSGIYSIKDNAYVDNSYWLNNYKVKVINNNEDDNTILFVEREISSNKLNNPKLLFSVNAKTLEPNSLCYSEYRNEFIDVKTKEDIDKIKLEDEKNIIMEARKLVRERNEKLMNAEKKILKLINNESNK